MKKAAAAATSRQRLCACGHQRFIFPEFERGSTHFASTAAERECSADFTFFGPQGIMFCIARLFRFI